MTPDLPDDAAGVPAVDPDGIEDGEDLREALGALLVAAEDAGVPRDAMAGLLTAYLAQLRGDVRLPLGMSPERARRLLDRAEEHVGETMEVEVLLTEEVLDELDLQLGALGRERTEG